MIVAFGMGLDYNVQPVVYWGGICQYIQKTGHTGREGMPMQAFYGKQI